MHKRTLLALLGIVYISIAGPLARAGVEQFVDAQTVAAGEADLTRVDPAAIEPWLREVMTATGFAKSADAQQLGEMNAAIASPKRWLSDVAAAGGKHIYAVTQGVFARNGQVAIIIPIEPGGDGKKLAALLFSRQANGPTSMPSRNAHGGPVYPFSAEVVGDNLAVWGTPSGIASIKNIKPMARPDLAAAMKALGESPIKIAIAPAAPLRFLLSKNLPEKLFDQPSTIVTNDLQWIAVGVSSPPGAGANVIMQSTSPASAQALHHIATSGLAAASGVPPTISPDMAKLLTPAVNIDQVVLTADNAKLMAIAKELGPQIAEAQKRALVVRSMSNERQILMACMMYSNDKNGAWPDDLKALDKYLPNVKEVMKNPLHPEHSPGYVYLKPAAPQGQPSETPALYEAHTDFGKGVGVGFADGHVEFISDKRRFDDLMAKSATDGVPQ